MHPPAANTFFILAEVFPSWQLKAIIRDALWVCGGCGCDGLASMDVVLTCVSLAGGQGKTVLELGSGCGLAGLVAAALGAHVVLTDLPTVVVSLYARPAARHAR